MAGHVNRTWLRHAMLAVIKDGRVSLRDGRWTFRSHPSTTSQMTRAVKSLQFGGYVAVAQDGRVELTADGTALLADWTRRGAL